MNCKQRLGAVYNSNPPRCALRPAVAHQTIPSPVREGRGGGSKQAALATVYKTNCKQPLGAVCNSNQPRCGLRSAVAHQTTPSPVGEGRGGGSKQAALATVYKTNCKQLLGRVCNLNPPPLRSGGGSGRGCEKPRSDRIQNELQTRSNPANITIARPTTTSTPHEKNHPQH